MKEKIGIIIGLIIIIASMAAGVYSGIWVMLVGGIVQIVEAVQANPVDSSMLALGIVKALFFEVGLIAPPLVGGFIGLGIIDVTEEDEDDDED